MGMILTLPRRFKAPGISDLINGTIVTDAVAALSSTVTGTATTNGALPAMTHTQTTTTTAALAVGATSVAVASTAGFANGDQILIPGAGQGGTDQAAGNFWAQITISGLVMSFFEIGPHQTLVPLAIQTAVGSGVFVQKGFLAGDYVSIAGGGTSGADLVATSIVGVGASNGTFTIFAYPGLPTSVTGAVMTRLYRVETGQVLKKAVLENLTTLQRDEWNAGMDYGTSIRTASSGARSLVTFGNGMFVHPAYILMPPSLLPVSSTFSLALSS